MANKFLDLLGLSEFLNQLKALFVTKNEIGDAQADWNVADETSNSYIKNKPTSMPASDVSPWAKASKKPTYTASEIGADPSGSASDALSSAKTYTNEKVSELINGAPETLDTLKEIADAIEENDTIVEALDNAIVAKANASDLASHINNSTIHVTASERTKWNSAKTHADSAHAPSNAERNTIVSLKKNGTALTPDSSRAINLEIPDDYIISGAQTTSSSADAGLNVYTFTKSDGTTSTFTVKNGSKGSTGSTGSTGTRGSVINWGTAITGTSTTATIFSGSGLTSSLVNDLYINTSTWNIYQCITSGSASVAKWTYKGNIKGTTGTTGLKGETGDQGVSISKVEQTTTSSADAGTNVVTVTLSNGVTSTFNVKNGSKGSTGTAGTSVTISSTSVAYQTSTSGTTTPTGTWSTTIPTVSAGSYLWTRTIVNYSNGTSTTAYSVGRNGNNGTNGTNGVSVSSVTQNATSTASSGKNTITVTLSNGTTSTFDVYNGAQGAKGDAGTSVTISSTSVTYQSGTSGTTAPTGTWTTTIPSVAEGNYLWTKTVVTYSNGSSTTSYSVSRNGTNGTNGIPGAAGTSVTISSTSVTYQSSTSGTTAPTGTWSSTIPTVAAGNYLWTRTIVTYSTGTSTTSYSVGKMGTNGTNATTTAVASATSNGLMSSGDFTKLSKVTATEMGYLSGITSSVQTQINGIANEVLSTSEPTNQKNGDYWIAEY